MAFQGNLQEFSVADLFNLLSQQKKSGILTLQRGGHKAVLELSQGAINKITLDDESPDSLVMKVLLRTSRVDDNLYSELQQAAKQTGKSLREMLVAKNYLSEEENSTWFKIAMEDMVLSLFFWKEGQYSFESKKVPVYSGNEFVSLPMDFLTLEGLRQVDEWPGVIEKFPDQKMIFKIKVTDYPDYDLGEGKSLMDRINGRTPIGSLQTELPFGAFRFFHFLLKLWEEGFIELEENISSMAAEPFLQAKPARKISGLSRLATGLGLAMLFAAVLLRLLWIEFAFNPETTWQRQGKHQAQLQAKRLLRDEILRGSRVPSHWRNIPGIDLIEKGSPRAGLDSLFQFPPSGLVQ